MSKPASSNPCTPCGNWYFLNKITGEKSVYFCNSARCNRPECTANWARKRIAICNDLVHNHGLTRFFTLSVDRSESCARAWEMISTWWKSLRKKINWWLKKLDRKLKFVAVLEAHKDGYPHIHGFWNIFIAQNVLSEWWSECAPGFMVDVRTVKDSKTASEYLGIEAGKYLGKKQSINGARMAGHRQRTIWRSRGLKTKFELDKVVSRSDNEWSLVKEDINGETEQVRTDMEAACQSVFTFCSTEGKCVLEAEACARCTDQEVGSPTEAERQNRTRDQNHEGAISHGDTKKRYQGNPASVQSG